MLSIGVSAAIINLIDSNIYFDAILAVENPVNDIASAQNLIRGSKSVAGFMIFLALISLIIEIPTIVGRFTLRGGREMLRILHIIVG